MVPRRRFISALAVSSALPLLAPLAARAQAYPSRQIRMVLPFGVGGPADVVGRLVAQKLGDALGQTVVVENMPGAGSTLAATQVARATPDGYTVLLANASTLTITQHLYRNLPYDPEKAFAIVGGVSQFSFVMGAANAVPANNLKELIAYARANPGKLNYGSPGYGTTPHLVAEMLKKAAGIDMVHVPFKTAAQAIQALVGGELQIFFDAPTLLVPLAQAGKIKALAVTSSHRLRELPQVATATESGVKEIEFSTWTALAVPSATPPEVLGPLRAALARVNAAPEMRETLISRGFEPFALPPEAIAQQARQESPRWAEIIRSANIKVE